MSPEFRARVFTPFILPLTAVGVILIFAIALSRVLLAIPEVASTLTAITVASYVLLVASLVAARPTITPRALGVGLVLGFAGVLAAGAVAGSVGTRPLHEEEEAAAEGEAAAPPASPEIPAGALLFTADTQLQFLQAPATATAGEVTIALDNQSGLPHNVTIEGVQGDQPIVEAVNAVEVGTVELEPRTYTYYCSIAGHREGGMEGQLTVQ
ncbi:MAG: plastocyanin/azurin family copper-binding protein [Egibacteraceae bacterium]